MRRLKWPMQNRQMYRFHRSNPNYRFHQLTPNRSRPSLRMTHRLMRGLLRCGRERLERPICWAAGNPVDRTQLCWGARSQDVGFVRDLSFWTINFSVQFKDFLQQRPDGLFRFVGRFCGIGNMSVSSEAIVRICERLMRRQIKDRARRFFFQHAKRRLCIWHVNGFGWERGIIKRNGRAMIQARFSEKKKPKWLRK